MTKIHRQQPTENGKQLKQMLSIRKRSEREREHTLKYLKKRDKKNQNGKL